MIKSTLIIAVLILFPSIRVYPQIESASFITIDADSRIEIPAKEITFSIVLEQLDTNAQKVYENLKAIEKKFLPLMKSFNIPDTSISYSLIQFRREGGFGNQPVKYRASENVVVKFNDFSKYEPFQMALLSIGVYTFTGTFSTTEVTKARELGFKEAVKKAENEAKTICKNLGRELGKVLEVESKNKDFVITSPMQGAYLSVEERKLIDIPQHVTLYTNLRIKYELK